MKSYYFSSLPDSHRERLEKFYISWQHPTMCRNLSATWRYEMQFFNDLRSSPEKQRARWDASFHIFELVLLMNKARQQQFETQTLKNWGENEISSARCQMPFDICSTYEWIGGKKKKMKQVETKILNILFRFQFWVTELFVDMMRGMKWC